MDKFSPKATATAARENLNVEGPCPALTPIASASPAVKKKKMIRSMKKQQEKNWKK